ncbi:class A beta-lactamase-related serine hydrolase [Mycobacterium sp. PS03-16]|uniref:serine hydrolase domain-containing protein n=1 Tax=Mycobacterium sp. PS03-16 TaxID=2559611 RepID=UPI0010739745|nr:serine hydrolase domain-containing protein [Mycobacterium sp. PS03-16]TFV60433.1 class A beta-lactamase-related serine hydrolase [Mycobacterium sp. PS03-16]
MRFVLAVATVFLVVATLAVAPSGHHSAKSALSRSVTAPTTTAVAAPRPAQAALPAPAPPPRPVISADFSTVSDLVNDAIAAHRLPGAVVLVGHGGHTVFQHAYGVRKLAGEPGLDGAAAPAEPMTKDTIFDLASLTKCLATAVAVMQLHEQGKVGLDDPVQKYLPAFNPAADAHRAAVTVRMLLTHFSGEAPDVNLDDPWGLIRADKDEGIRRALTSPLQSRPGDVFRYSDINFILLGALIEKVTGEPEDVYAERNIFAPLGMSDTRYLPPDKACGPHTMSGAVLRWASAGRGALPVTCAAGTWRTDALARIAPTAHDDEGRRDPRTNPDWDHLLRGAVHDTTTRRMGGVAGHAGVFSTAHDVGIFAQALLDRLANRPSAFPLRRETLELMTTPAQPGHTAHQAAAAHQASADALRTTPNTRHPLLAPNYPAIGGQNLRGFGWDIDTAQSAPRGVIFPVGSFGHTGFTGTSMWIDPGSDTFVVLLANAIHPRGNAPISILRGEVATAAARALGLYRGAPR